MGKLVCLDSSNKFREAKVKKCHELGGDQEWKIGDEGQNTGDGSKSTAIYNSAAGEPFLKNQNHPSVIGFRPILDECRSFMQ